MNRPTLERLRVTGLHGHQNFDVPLQSGLNILHGTNGSGKTTSLHIIANLLERDFEPFLSLRFETISILTSLGDLVELHQDRGPDGPSILVRINEFRYGRITQSDNLDPSVGEEIGAKIGTRPVYLPAFRSILEAISRDSSRNRYGQDITESPEYRSITQQEIERIRTGTERKSRVLIGPIVRQSAEMIAYKTLLCRDWFGRFVPIIRSPSLREVAHELSRELTIAESEIAESDRAAFANVFVDVLRAVLDINTGPETATALQDILARIQQSLGELDTGQAAVPAVYSQISSLIRDNAQHLSLEETYVARILDVYDRAFKERVSKQQAAFARIEIFEQSVNRFLQGKRLHVRGHERRMLQVSSLGAGMIRLSNGKAAGLNALSSGERQVVTLLFSATHLAAYDGLVLIDEPELSLHVGWQRIILDELLKQAEGRQIVVCTHAPEITANHRDRTIRFAPSIWRPEQTELVDSTEAELDVL